MTDFLDALIADAVGLTEQELPAPDSVRAVLGAVVKHVEAIETHLLGAAAAPVQQLQTAAATTVEQAIEPTMPAASAAGETKTPAWANLTVAAAPAGPVTGSSPLEELEAERQAQITELETRLAALKGESLS